MSRRILIALALACVIGPGSSVGPAVSAQTRRPLQPDDIFSLKSVADPRISPDGAWVAYTVSTLDRKEDNSDTDVYMVAASGGTPVRLTSSKKPENAPRWSPDGRYLAFLSARDGKKPQVFLLDRRGGDAQAITDYKTGASAVAWSPDSSKLALLVSDPDPNDPETAAPSTGSGQAPSTGSGQGASTGSAEGDSKKPKPHVNGTDHYQRQWEAELGLPSQNTALWIKLSPFYRLDKIVTPTLVMGGEADMNVPILGGQQLYQGLRRLGRETELVIYPGENHSIRRPSFQQDRFERYIAWYTKYLKPATKTSSQ